MSEEIVGHKTFSDGHGGFRHEPLTRSEADALWQHVGEAKAKRAAYMPTDQDAVSALWSAYERLRELGWREPRFAPKDRDMLLIELGSSGIHTGKKMGETDCFWMALEGDLWPSHPCLVKEQSNAAERDPSKEKS